MAFTKLGRFHISSVVDLGPITPLVVAGASAFHVLREVVKIVLKPIVGEDLDCSMTEAETRP